MAMLMGGTCSCCSGGLLASSKGGYYETSLFITEPNLIYS